MSTQPYPTIASPVADPSGRSLRAAFAYLRAQAGHATAPPTREHRRARFLWGFAQPVLGLCILARNKTLLGDALLPVVTVATFCMIAAVASGSEIDESGSTAVWHTIVSFFAAFIALAPIPPCLFGRQYAELAARARTMLGLGPCLPWIDRTTVSIGKTIAQTIIMAIGVAPFTIPLALLAFGIPLAIAVQALWTWHWMIVEGLDNGRTLSPGQSIEQLRRADVAMRHDPWYHRWIDRVPSAALRMLLAPVRMVAEIVSTLGRSWSQELRIVEHDPAVCLGFGIGLVALLAVPGLNLFFRPAVIIGAAHLRGRLDHERRV